MTRTPCTYCGSAYHARLWCEREGLDRSAAAVRALESQLPGTRKLREEIRQADEQYRDTAQPHDAAASAPEERK